jgi:hypothetical protein
MLQRTAIIGFWLAAGLVLSGCKTGPSQPPRPHLTGTVRRSTYISSAGGFSVPFPVSPEVGGRVVSDTPDSATFHDNWGSRITFSSVSFTAQSSMMATMQSQGRERALAEFAKRQYNSDIDVHFHTNTLGGTISFIFIRPVGSGTGVAMFVQGWRVFSVETDMLPGVQLLGQSDEKSRLDRLIWLEGRAVTLAQTMNVK